MSSLFNRLTERLAQSEWIQQYSEFLLTEIDPLLSRQKQMARVVRIQDETADTKTFFLQPHRAFPSFQAGQHVPVHWESQGVRHRRYYSLTCSPEQYASTGLLSFTIKLQPGGRVSPELHYQLRINTRVELGQPSGAFVLPTGDKPLLFLAAGSGITPFLSMLESPATLYRDIVLLHYANTEADLICRKRLQQLDSERDHFTYLPMASNQTGQICLKHLQGNVTERLWLLCGPLPFMQKARELADELGVPADHRFQESFGGAVTRPTASFNATGKEAAQVVFEQSQLSTTGTSGASLLEIAEHAGLRPKAGCRAGICHECKCEKRAGRVRNRLTGQEFGEELSFIQPCIYEPVGEVRLAL